MTADSLILSSTKLDDQDGQCGPMIAQLNTVHKQLALEPPALVQTVVDGHMQKHTHTHTEQMHFLQL